MPAVAISGGRVTKLHDMQEKFLRDVLSREVPLEGGMRVYQNNTRLILQELLLSVYPVTTRLLGVDFMKQTAVEFIQRFPPESGDMNLYGDGFGDFLGYIPALGKYPYLPDTARLEWLCHAASVAPAEPVLSAEDLANVADPLNMKLYLQPHVRILRAGWPVGRIWDTLSGDKPVELPLDIKPEETFIVVTQGETGVVVRDISEGAYAFIERLSLDPSFAFAAQAAIHVESDLALDRFLALAVAGGLFRRLDSR